MTNLTVSEILGKHPSLIVGLYRGKPILKPETVELERQLNELLEKAYREGYNDNARICNCDDILPVDHMHLLDDGKSYDIRLDVLKETEVKDE